MKCICGEVETRVVDGKVVCVGCGVSVEVEEET